MEEGTPYNVPWDFPQLQGMTVLGYAGNIFTVSFQIYFCWVV